MADATTRLGGSVGIAALASLYATAGFHNTIWVLVGLAALGLLMTSALPRLGGSQYLALSATAPGDA